MSDDPDTAPASRALDIRLTCGTDVGYAIWEGGHLVAAFKWRHQLAEWLFERLAELPGEVERENRELGPPAPPDNVEAFPRVAQPRPRTEPPRGRGFFGR